MFLLYNSLSQYSNRCNWLKNERFLKDLEGDSVDTDILDEELQALQEDEPKTYVPRVRERSCIIIRCSVTKGECTFGSRQREAIVSWTLPICC